MTPPEGQRVVPAQRHAHHDRGGPERSLAIAPSLECVRLMCAIRLGPCPRIMEAQVEKLIISEVDLHVVTHCNAAVFALWK